MTNAPKPNPTRQECIDNFWSIAAQIHRAACLRRLEAAAAEAAQKSEDAEDAQHQPHPSSHEEHDRE